MPSFRRVSAAGRNEPDDGVANPIAVGHDEDSKSTAEPEEQEPIFGLGVFRVLEEQGVFIGEDRLGFGKRDAMFAPVGGRFAGVPFEPKLAYTTYYTYVVCTPSITGKREPWERAWGRSAVRGITTWT